MGQGAPMCNILSRVVCEVECHQGKLVQAPLPQIVPAIYDLRIMFKVLFLLGWHDDRRTSVLVSQFPG
jgi:hypothetical protein